MNSSSNNYLDYLHDGTELNSEFLEDIKYEMDARLYHYGNHFNANNENKLFEIKMYLFSLLVFFKGFLKKLFQQKITHRNIVISSAYFGINDELVNIGYDCINVPWLDASNNLLLYYKLQKFKNKIKNFNFSEIDSLYKDYIKIRTDLKSYYSKNEIKFLTLPQDVGVFERLSIRIFKEFNKKTFIFSHGLPGRYNNIDDNKTDFLVVWGNKIKNNYIKAGFNENKIIVSGHPLYKKLNIDNIKLRSSLNNILVLSKSLNGTPHSTGVKISDRTNLLLYLYQLQKELLQSGVKSVKFRPHPSENIKWYYNFIDPDFFIIDANKSITDSFKEATLVIGPTSTMFIDSIVNNVNYLVYEPMSAGNDLNNFPLVPPFDSTDERLIISKSPIELSYNLKRIPLVEPSIILDYIQPNFDISFLINE
jgi:hypothetical protein